MTVEALCDLLRDGDPDDPDWARLLDLAAAHHVTGRIDADAVPAAHTERVRAAHRESAGHGLGLVAALQAVDSRLAEASIPALAFKGPILSDVVAGDLGVRRSVDVDLAVPDDQFAAAERALVADGYDVVERFRGLGEVTLRDTDGVSVDLHRSVLGRALPRRPGVETLLDRGSRRSVGGRTVATLSPVDRAVVLAVHGTKHRWYRLDWICDWAALTEEAIDWHAVDRRARSWSVRGAVLTAAWIARAVLGADLPGPLSAAVDADPRGRSIGQECLDALRAGPPTPPADRAQFRTLWRALDRRRDRLQYGVRVATIPSEADRAAVPLPDALDGLYRVVRPIRLGVRAARDIPSGD
ncbi:nucleotidyltransferase domain-containing protein [Halococcoides cellulosivorans]|uniref:nucleotidyltransferase domain-containing protein n=1 Tax=Halococcoides cellulosivorans TaxID=1679096 RepID=UPI00131F41AA|nr:nucleotidyltransferase family protein [Halococcoides cellulosivorans]